MNDGQLHAATLSVGAPDHTTTSLDTIVVEKVKLLETLRTNRTNHKAVYDAACDGFWVSTTQKLREKKVEFEEAIVEANKAFDEQLARRAEAVATKAQDKLFPFHGASVAGYGNTSLWQLDFERSWAPAFPSNHIEDYDRAITQLEYSVAKKVSLSVSEFDAYVRNNWKWQEEFATSNRGYITAITGAYFANNTVNAATWGLLSGVSVAGSSALRS